MIQVEHTYIYIYIVYTYMRYGVENQRCRSFVNSSKIRRTFLNLDLDPLVFLELPALSQEELSDAICPQITVEYTHRKKRVYFLRNNHGGQPRHRPLALTMIYIPCAHNTMACNLSWRRINQFLLLLLAKSASQQ